MQKALCIRKSSSKIVPSADNGSLICPKIVVQHKPEAHKPTFIQRG